MENLLYNNSKVNILLRLLWHRRVLSGKTRWVVLLNKGIG